MLKQPDREVDSLGFAEVCGSGGESHVSWRKFFVDTSPIDEGRA